MLSEKQNCWEHQKCGREPGGKRAGDLGVCPAAADTSFDGLNHGKNAGRICWAVAGTFCGGEVQGTYAEKRETCMKCDFFRKVRNEEGTSASHTKFLRFISENADTSFLKALTYKHVRSGERFITQGDPGEHAYIIQSGTCLLIVEKDGEMYPSEHRGEGDIVGVTSVLTGEPRGAHVEAETDMNLWVLNKSRLDNITRDDPVLLNFLTELVANRFDSARPVPKRIIGKYIATDIIDRGGYSIVYKGVHANLGMPVVIKMMRHDLAMNPEFLKSFHNEARTIAGLNHENIIRVYDIEERFRTVFIIMEYLKGQSLKETLIRLKTLPLTLAADFLFQICSGLDYAHQQGIIHRDINPMNIFIQPDDRVKLLDFGLACPPGTEDFMYGGQLAYQAPEMIQGEPPDERTDIYALGITAYEMVTGKRPFPEDDPGTLMKLHRTQDIPDPAKIRPHIPRALRWFILKACRRNPAQRYQHVREALADLGAFIATHDSGHRQILKQERKMTTLFLFYKDEHQQALNRVLEEFSSKVKDLGIDLKAADVQDV